MKSKNDLAVIVTSPYHLKVYYYPDFKEVIFSKSFRKEKSLSENFMLGVKNSNSIYLMRIDEDDYLYIYLNENAQFGIETGLEILKRRPIIKALFPFYELIYVGVHKNILIEPQGSGIIYERQAFLDVGGYNQKLDLQADLDFYIRFTSFYDTSYYPMIYRWLISSNSRSLKRKKEILKVRKEILNKYNLEDWEVHHFGAYYFLK